ncbi:hypothetical protein AAJ76_2700045217 [Vairimorpha ceranae]|uniref:Uncharacterized protein n=1 Tax=Vairimorpha ceranae TaxID=40302 RepID=A0A0F9YRM7_9MICR|nr:hypothetical protein AAJ76_2700045217 [Vairimorpha ceranae]KAF5140515.1 hypothetical protein G9O61_00g013200 [Vairimorpha ceranae]KKO75257.1 hypothetical protein AAJ76_2700045217 [Vairimorpha ceranae]
MEEEEDIEELFSKDQDDLILLKRESLRHDKIIKKSYLREQHIYLKNIGYSNAAKKFPQDKHLVNLLYGFLKTKKVSDINICTIFYELVQNENDLLCQVEDILTKYNKHI